MPGPIVPAPGTQREDSFQPAGISLSPGPEAERAPIACFSSAASISL